MRKGSGINYRVDAAGPSWTPLCAGMSPLCRGVELRVGDSPAWGGQGSDVRKWPIWEEPIKSYEDVSRKHRILNGSGAAGSLGNTSKSKGGLRISGGLPPPPSVFISGC